MSPIQSKDFDKANLGPYMEKLWTASSVDELISFRDFLSSDGAMFDKMHVASGAIDAD